MKWVSLYVMAILFGGCMASHQSVVENVSMEAWSEDVSLSMINHDTVTLRSLELFARYSPLMVSDSVRLTIEVIAPDSTTYSEEVTLRFDTQKVERGACRVSSYPYRDGVVLRQDGEYRILIKPTSTLRGVEAIGVNTKRSDR